MKNVIVILSFLLIGGGEKLLSAQEVGHKDTVFVTSNLPLIVEFIGIDSIEYETITHLRVSDFKTNKEIQVVAETTGLMMGYNVSSDVNFDGFKDLAFECLNNLHGDVATEFFLFDKETGLFVKNNDFVFINLFMNNALGEIYDGGSLGGYIHGEHNKYIVKNNHPVLIEKEGWDELNTYTIGLIDDSLMTIKDHFKSKDTTWDGISCISFTDEERIDSELVITKKMYAPEYDLEDDSASQQMLTMSDDNHICEKMDLMEVTCCWFQQEIYTYDVDERGKYVEIEYQKVHEGNWVTTKTTKKYNGKEK